MYNLCSDLHIWLFQVVYHSYLDAFKLAKAEDKLVHFIMLWGALDDQSC